jgi:propanol-preferring alcohol dehydrogenase
MPKMRAYRLLEWGAPPQFMEVDVPRPGPGEVLVGVAAAGICGSDLHLVHAPPGLLPFSPPFTMGHENTGWVAELGLGVKTFSVGEAVLASSSTSCGHCDPCVGGHDNYCTQQVNMSSRMMTMKVRGIGLDGGFAQFMVVPARDLVSLDDLDPLKVAPLACAGATSYHAVIAALPVLTPGESCLVIGTGGLGSFAVQYLKLLSASRIIATDLNPVRLEVAIKMGAHATLLADQAASEKIIAMTARKGAAAVLDFVGSAESLGLATAVVQPNGKIIVPGINLGSISFGWGSSAPGCDYRLTLGFTNKQLREVVALARSGALALDTERFAFDEIPAAIDRLAKGELRGRAVIEIGQSPS